VSVTLRDVEYVAALAHLTFSDEEKRTLTAQLNTILEYMDQLNTVNTEHVEPLTQVVELQNVFRKDVPSPGLTREEALQNAPDHSEKFFKVPKVIGEK
jgi:aspartyl-tRNA(Asn)/glutamyl-tRNA(Gln) amidotransferase subunit C